jgi:hypothetical protein
VRTKSNSARCSVKIGEMPLKNIMYFIDDYNVAMVLIRLCYDFLMLFIFFLKLQYLQKICLKSQE